MASFMNNYFYGKAGKADFTEDELPTNRFQLFFQTLRLHVTGLMGMNLLLVLFSLPAIVWTVINLSVITQVETNEVFTYMCIYLLGMILCLMLVGVGMSGAAYILRNWARDQHTFTMSDFKDSVKANWKLGLLNGGLTGVVLFMGYFCYMFYGSMANTSSAFWVIPEVLVIAFCLLMLMSTMLSYPMLVTYDLKFRHVLRNSILLTLRRLPFALLTFALSVAIPIAMMLVFYPYGLTAFIVIYLLIGIALTEFVYVSFANSCFDRYLNPLIEGAPVNIGLHEKSDDDEDEEQPPEA